jgi:regulator of cell morphogenesis and NO signaling
LTWVKVRPAGCRKLPDIPGPFHPVSGPRAFEEKLLITTSQPSGNWGGTVGEIAATTPGATGVFRRFKLDFCCGGDVPLREAALKRGVDPADVERALDALAPEEPDAANSLPTDALIAHIVSRYHEAHRRDLPELVRLARKVEAVHGEHPEAPLGLAVALQQILFPAMLAGASGPLDGPLAQMRDDHDEHGAALRYLEQVTGGFALPEGACRSWTALYLGVEQLVDDVMDHIHLENNVLFPRYDSAAPAEASGVA